VNGTTLALLAAYIAYALAMLVVYGRQRRWSGAFGWPLLVGGAALALGGAGDWFAWGGLLWSCVAAFGLLLIGSDVYLTRLRRGRAGHIRNDA
jgi:hypothetical protein